MSNIAYAQQLQRQQLELARLLDRKKAWLSMKAKLEAQQYQQHHLSSQQQHQMPPVVIYPGEKKQSHYPFQPNTILNNTTTAESGVMSSELIPIRLDFEFEGQRVRDTFIYNQSDPQVTPTLLAQVICADFQLSPNALPLMIKLISERIALERPPPPSSSSIDLKIWIKLDILEQGFLLQDQFELWLPFPASDTPESIALCLVRDCNLPQSFLSSIAHSIREQVDGFYAALAATANNTADREVVLNYYKPPPHPCSTSGAVSSNSSIGGGAGGGAGRKYKNLRGPLVTPLDYFDEEEGAEDFSANSTTTTPAAANTNTNNGGGTTSDRQMRLARRQFRVYAKAKGVAGEEGRENISKRLKLSAFAAILHESTRRSPLPCATSKADSRGKLQMTTTASASTSMAVMEDSKQQRHHHRRRHRHRQRLYYHTVGAVVERSGQEEGDQGNCAACGISMTTMTMMTTRQTYHHRLCVQCRRQQNSGATTAISSELSDLSSEAFDDYNGGSSQSDREQPSLAPPPAPEWLMKAYRDLMGRNSPSNSFEIVMRPNKPGIYAVKCHNCFGKLYTPGPGKTLGNFEVHLKNRAHQEATLKSANTSLADPTTEAAEQK